MVAKKSLLARMFSAEQKGLLALFTDLRKHHFQAGTALLMSLSFSIFYFSVLKTNGKTINPLFVAIACAIAFAITLLVLNRRMRDEKFVPSWGDYFDELLPLVSLTMVMGVFYLLLNLLLARFLLSIAEFCFMFFLGLCLMTLMLHVRSSQW